MRKFKCISAAILLLGGCGSTAGYLPVSNPASQSLAVEVAPLLPPAATSDRILVDDEPATLDLLANDTHEGGRVQPFRSTGSAGGQASLSESGIFSYTPPPGNAPFQETYVYTLSNDAGTSQTTVTAQRSRTVYVRNDVSNGDGSKGRPYNNIQSALNDIGSSSAQIFVYPGDHSFKGLDVPLIVLQPGQHIQGANSGDPPSFLSHFQLPTTDCSLSNLIIAGSGTGPLIRAQGNVLPVQGTPKLLISNLLLRDHVGDGINLDQPAETELTNVQVIRLNQKEGSAALSVTNPVALVKASGWKVFDNPRGALRLENNLRPPFLDPNAVNVQVEMNGIELQGVNNATQVLASAGKLTFFLLKVVCSTNDLSGTLVQGDVSGDAAVDAYVDHVDLRTVGSKTAVLDWVYRQTSQGIFRLGTTNCEIDAKDGVENPLHLAIRDQAQASYLSSYSKVNSANKVLLEAFDTSLLKVRIQKYSYGSTGPKYHDMVLYAHDRANVYSRIRDDLSHYGGLPPRSVKIGYAFLWKSDVDAMHTIENFWDIFSGNRDEASGNDNPDTNMGWDGWIEDILYDGVYHPDHWDDQFDVLRDGTKTYTAAETDTLGIPRFEGLAVP